MICYRDKTFCPFYEDCLQGDTCDRAYTEGIKVGAVRWWGHYDAPVALFANEPACYDDKNVDTSL